jgi:hypothetical protein
VASSPSAVHAALLKAGQEQPHFVAFVDRGCLYLPGAVQEDVAAADALHPAQPAVYAVTGTGHMVIYASQQRAAAEAARL